MRRLAHPLRLGADGRLVSVIQHTGDHADQQVHLVRATRHGDRVCQPTVGIPDPTDQPDAVIAEFIDVAVDVQVTAGTRTGPTTIRRSDPSVLVADTPIRPRRR